MAKVRPSREALSPAAKAARKRLLSRPRSSSRAARQTVTPLEQNRRDEIKIARRVNKLNTELAVLARRCRLTSRAASGQVRALVDDFADRLNLAVISRVEYARLIKSIERLELRNQELERLAPAGALEHDDAVLGDRG